MIAKPTLEDIYDEIREDVTNALGIIKRHRFSVINVIAKALAAVLFSIYSYADRLAASLLPDSARKEVLERWCAIFGVFRKPASNSSGLVVIKGNTGTLVPKDLVIQDEAGQQFRTFSSKKISGNAVSVDVRSLGKGRSYNLIPETALTLVTPIEGLDSAVQVSGTGLTGGADEESDLSLRSRFLERIRNPPRGGSRNDYIIWAKQISGITRAWAFPEYQGVINQIGVTFVLDSQNDIIPQANSSKFRELEAHLKSKAPIGARVKAFIPAEYEVRLTLKINPDTPDLRYRIEQEMLDFFYRTSQVGDGRPHTGEILISKIRETISTTEGEQDHELISPTQNIHVVKGQIAVFKGITWV
jgi:uncharacterized phage protein gp47/JayE